MKNLRTLFVLCLLAGMMFVLPARSLGQMGQGMGQSRSEMVLASLKNRPYVADEILIQYRYGTQAQTRASVNARFGLNETGVLLAGANRKDGRGDLVVAKMPPGRDIAEMMKGIESDWSVEYAEPNWIYTTDATSNDPYYTNGSLWGMYGDATSPVNQFGSHAGEAWAAGYTGSSGVYIGIIDEGFMTTHADLAANVWVNPYDPVDGRDNDGNGYIDDRNGWDFDGNNNSVYDGTIDDHGTHVAGTIGAVGGNSIGVAGVVWNVKMISGKFLGRNGGTTANAIRAIDYFTDLKTRHGLNIVATNNSWGGGGYSQGLFDAIERANNAGILFVAAAGNGGGDGVGDDNDTTPNYPSNYTNSNVIAVASITNTGARSSFSNYGATTVDIGAPGSSINSTLPTRTGTGTYGAYSGTSMATPHVTGAVALYASVKGGTAAQIKNAILSSAIPTSSLSGLCVTGGRLDAYAALSR